MKRLLYTIIFLPALIILHGCTDENNETALPFSGKLISHTECLGNIKSAVVPGNLSCAEYLYDEENELLKITHFNAGFNCCPESLFCKINLRNDTIYIEEFEKSALCKCNCLYNIEFEITGIKPAAYNISFAEPYTKPKDKLFFGIDLENDTEGKFCVKRYNYPWGLRDN